MANLLKMANVQSILSLHAQGWTQRRIARELGIDRETVRKYVRQELYGAKPANVPTGSCEPKPANVLMLPAPEAKPASLPAKPANLPTGSAEPKPANVLTGSTPVPAGDLAPPPLPPAGAVPTGLALPPGLRSKCAAHREWILARLQEGLSARRIHQDLGGDQAGFGYDSVRRFIQRLGRRQSLPYRRMECEPGKEAQVDFGAGAFVVQPDGKRRKTHVFRVVLSHSRKGYSEATYTQSTEDFLRCLENAFAHFGGVPQTLVIDNLKAAVAHPDWFDPELTPKVQSFCQHYGTVILPTKPYMPRHKGKIEAGVKYVKNNALKGHTFNSLEAENRHLADWEQTVADTRIHGTTKQQVGKLFAEVERAALLALTPERFACFQEGQRKVNRDGHIEVAKAYYSAPPEYLGRSVWVRWDPRLVRIFNHRFEQIALHLRQEPGRFSTLGEHLHPRKINGLERGAEYLLNQVRAIGSQASQWAQAMLHARGIEGTRVLQGLLALSRTHRRESLEKACETALSHGAFRLRTLRQLLKHQPEVQQQPLPFLDEHPIIRPLDDYGQIIVAALARREGFLRHDRTAECQERVVEIGFIQDESPGGLCHQGSRDVHPPWPGYPSSSCTSAELDSVSPDLSSVVPPCSLHQEIPHD